MSEKFRRETFGKIEALLPELRRAYDSLNQYCERYRQNKDYMLSCGEAMDGFERRHLEHQQRMIEADIKDVVAWLVEKNEKLATAWNEERGNPVCIVMGALPPTLMPPTE